MNLVNFIKHHIYGLTPTVQDSVADITGKMQHLPRQQELQSINNEKLEAAKKYLGAKWILHPDNKCGKSDKPQTFVLG